MNISNVPKSLARIRSTLDAGALAVGAVAIWAVIAMLFSGPPVVAPGDPSEFLLDTMVREADNVEIKIQESCVLSSIRDARRDTIYTPEKGKVFLVCRVTITNMESSTLDIEPSGFKMDATTDRPYRSRFTGTETPIGIQLTRAKLSPGEDITGDVVFEVDRGAIPIKMSYFRMIDPL